MAVIAARSSAPQISIEGLRIAAFTFTNAKLSTSPLLLVLKFLPIIVVSTFFMKSGKSGLQAGSNN